MDFTLLGKTITISDGMKAYLQILHDFRAMAEQAKLDFRAQYDDLFGLVLFNSSYAEKFKKTYGSDHYMDKIVMGYVSKARQYLSKYGVYTLSDDAIWEAAVLSDDRDTSILQDEFDSFILECIALDEDDDAFISRLKRKFEGTYLQTCLYNDIMALWLYVANYLNDNHLVDIQFVYKQDVERAEAIYQNLQDNILTDEKFKQIMLSMPSGLSEDELEAEFARRRGPVIPEAEEKQLAVSLIELDPRNKEYFQFIFEQFPDARYEIAAIARYLGVDLSEQITDDINEQFALKSVSTEEQALQMMTELQQAMEKYGLTDCKRKQELDAMLKQFDIDARTYDGILYETRDLQAQAKKDDETLAALCQNVSALDKEGCLQLIETIQAQECTNEVKKKHIANIRRHITNIDKANLEKMVAAISSADEATCNEVKAQVEAYDADKALKDPFLAKIDARIKTIWTAEDMEVFREIFFATPVGDSAAVGKSCSEIQRIGRTALKEDFVKALYFLNEEEVNNAAKYLSAKESGTLATLFNLGKKGSFEILTLNGTVIHPAITEAAEALKAKKSGGLFGGLMGKKAVCPACGAKNSASAKFCDRCGNKLN